MEKFVEEFEDLQLESLRANAEGQIRQLLTDHSVLVFRGQNLGKAELESLARVFGPEMRPIQLASTPEWILQSLSDHSHDRSVIVENSFLVRGNCSWCVLAQNVSLYEKEGLRATIPSIILDRDGGVIDRSTQIDVLEFKGPHNLGASDVWHSDRSFLEQPPKAGILFAETVPESVCDTVFSDMISALSAISPRLRGLLSGCRAIHTVDGHLNRVGQQRGRALKIPALPPVVSHPVIRLLQDRKEECLYVNPFYTREIEHLYAEESNTLLDLLFGLAVKPEFTYRHRWRAGDVVIWDNRATMHYGVKDMRGPGQRKLLRVLSEGEVPIPGT